MALVQDPHHVTYRVGMWQVQFEQLLIVFAEVRVILQIVQGIARTGLEQKQRHAGHDYLN